MTWSKAKLIAYGWTACTGSAVLVSWVYAGDEWSVPALELLAWLGILGLSGFWVCVGWFLAANGACEWVCGRLPSWLTRPIGRGR